MEPEKTSSTAERKKKSVSSVSAKRCAATLGFSAEMGANSKHNNWNLICHQMGDESTPLAIETGEHLASKT